MKVLYFILFLSILIIPVTAEDAYTYYFNDKPLTNATISILKQDESLYRSWDANELGAYNITKVKLFLQSKWSSLPNGYVFYIQVQKYPFDRIWKLQRIDATHIKVNDGNTYTTSTVWTHLKKNLRLTEPAGLGYADRIGVTVSSTTTGVRVDGSGDAAKVFIPGNLNYRYIVQHVNNTGSVTDEFVVYPQLIDSDYYVVFDADEWSYYTVDGSLIEVGITDIRLVGDTVQITGDGYNQLMLQSGDNSKLRFWNEYSLAAVPNEANSPWNKYQDGSWVHAYFSAMVSDIYTNSGTSITYRLGTSYAGGYTKTSGHLNIDANLWIHDTTNDYYSYQFYIDNDHTSSQDVVIETYTPDHIDHFIVEMWNGTAGAYQEILNDSTYTAANLINLNNSSSGLDFAYYESGQRGDTVSAIYGNTSKPDQTISAYYGVINRTLMLFTLPADDGADSATSGASQVKLRLTVYYIDPGYATYEFEDSTNQYYGLDNINGDTMMLYKAGTQNVTYITNESGNAITGMTVRADENGLIDRLYITYASTPTNLSGLIINQSAIDVDTDSDGDNVPDAFEDANITANKNAQGGELKWDYLWGGCFNYPNTTGYIYYTNLINGSGLVGTEIQTASTTGTANISMNTAGAGETYNFTVNSGTVDWLNVTSGLAVGTKYGIYDTSLIEEQTADASGYVNFTSDLVAGTYYIKLMGYTVSGTVYDKNNVGYSGVSITLGSSSTTTADNGTFSFSTIEDGTYTLTAFIDADGTLSKAITISGSDVTGQDFYYSDQEGGGAGPSGKPSIIGIVEITTEDGEILGKGVRVGLEDAWLNIDLISISRLLSGEDAKDTWNVIALIAIIFIIAGLFDTSKTTRPEILLIIGFVGIGLYAIYQDIFAVVIGFG